MPAAIAGPIDTQWLIYEAPPLLTKNLVRRIGRIDRNSLDRLIAEGLLPVVPFGDGQVRITRAALMRYLGLSEPADRNGAA